MPLVPERRVVLPRWACLLLHRLWHYRGWCGVCGVER